MRLGLCYQLGLGGLELGIKNALDLYEVASMKGHPFAHACIGRAYECGEGHRWDPPMVGVFPLSRGAVLACCPP